MGTWDWTGSQWALTATGSANGLQLPMNGLKFSLRCNSHLALTHLIRPEFSLSWNSHLAGIFHWAGIFIIVGTVTWVLRISATGLNPGYMCHNQFPRLQQVSGRAASCQSPARGED